MRSEFGTEVEPERGCCFFRERSSNCHRLSARLPWLHQEIRRGSQSQTGGAASSGRLYRRCAFNQGFDPADATAPRNCVAAVSSPICLPMLFPASVEKR
jgi:hypothetical protein